MDHENRMRRDAEFARWYTTHHDRIRSFCARILRDDASGEDLAQETLLRAWTRRDRMREEDLGAWLTVVARNLCVSHLRRHKRVVPTEFLSDVPDEAADPAREVERIESRRAVRKAMREVGERNRILLFRREVEEVDYAALGAEFGLTAGGTRSVLFRARRVLRDRLAAVGEGVGAWIFGVRVRLSRWTRDNPVVVEATAGPMLQAGLSLVLAVGLAAGPVTGSSTGATISRQPAVPLANRSVVVNHALPAAVLAPRVPLADAVPVGDRGGIDRFRDENVRVERNSDFYASVPAPNRETKLIEIGEYSQPGPENSLPYEGSKRQEVWDLTFSHTCDAAPQVCEAIFADP